MRFSKLGRPFILMSAAHIHNSTWKLLNVFLDPYCSHIFAIYLPNIVILFIHILILLLSYVCSVHTTSVACCPSWKRDPCFIAHPKVSSIEVLVSCADLKPFKTNVWYGHMFGLFKYNLLVLTFIIFVFKLSPNPVCTSSVSPFF